MAVGAGSIKRAAKANLETSGVTEQVKKEKTPAKKAGSSHKVYSSKDTSLKDAPSKNVNQVCHITEDLPIHLL